MAQRNEMPRPSGNPPRHAAELKGIDGATARIRVLGGAKRARVDARTRAPHGRCACGGTVRGVPTGPREEGRPFGRNDVGRAAACPKVRVASARFTVSKRDRAAGAPVSPDGRTGTVGPHDGSGTGTTDSGRGDWSFRQVPFLAMAVVWIVAIYAVSRDRAMEQLLFVGTGMLLLGAPMCLAGICSGALRRQRKVSAMFRQQGWLYSLLLGRWPRILAWSIWGLAMSGLLLLQLHFYDRVGWAVLVLVVPLFSAIFTVMRRRLSHAGMHEDVAFTQALAGSRWVCAALMVLLYVVAMTWLGDSPRFATIEAAVAARTGVAEAWSGNALVGEALRGLAYFHGVEGFVLGELRAMDVASGWWLFALIVTGFGNFALLYNACLALSCFGIPRAAFVRAELCPRSSSGAFTIAVVATFLPVFILLPLLAQFEPMASEIADRRERAEETASPILEAVLRVERIEGDANCSAEARRDDGGSGCLYRAGTVEAIRIARSDAAGRVGAAADELRREVDAAFARLESEAVEEYLDWYYSLAGEYGRLWMLLRGGAARLERHVKEKGLETFGREEYFEGVEAAIDRVFDVEGQASDAYEREVRSILDRNRLDAGQGQVEVVLTESLDSILQPSFHQDFLPAAHRFGVAGVGGSAAGAGVARVVAHKVTAKILGKSLIKLGVKMPIKALASKAGASAAAGGVAGSVVPFAGTAVGAVAGFVVGIGGGVAIDGALLGLEEALAREDFRREIVAAIRETRREFEDQHFGRIDSSSGAAF